MGNGQNAHPARLCEGLANSNELSLSDPKLSLSRFLHPANAHRQRESSVSVPIRLAVYRSLLTAALLLPPLKKGEERLITEPTAKSKNPNSKHESHTTNR